MKNGCAGIRFVVEDFGMGIKECDKENIFKEFFTNKKTGTGIGLSVCKKLLDEHKADIYFESEFGYGTRFFVDFPSLIIGDLVQYKILLIDDDNLFSTALERILVKLDYNVRVCQDAGRVFEILEIYEPDIILLDIYLTTHNGLDILKILQKDHPDIPVVMITGYADVKIAVTAMKHGAYDFLLKPIDIEQLNTTLRKITSHLNLKNEVIKFQTILSPDVQIEREYFGKSKSIQKVLNAVEKLAVSDNTTILLEGESGTGKEVFARYIHQLSPRKNKVFVAVNCATITKELAESELFGHEKGAFTGAAQRTKLGKFELADGGTIFIR